MKELHELAASTRDKQPAPIKALAKLPVFFDLHGRSVIVAGDSDAAIWKVQLLLAAAAKVRWFVASTHFADSAMAAFEAGQDLAQVEIVTRPVSRADFDNVTLAVIDASSDEQAQAFCELASSAGVPSNVIDNTAFGSFQFGTVVNRSPVVIGISTSGAAPILAQTIRRHIEVVLPNALSAWAELAQRIRSTVKERLPNTTDRRRFWDSFSEKIFSNASLTGSDAEHLPSIVESTNQSRGSVTLVGAGPGDADLLTLKAVRALQAADVILFDDLVSDEVLELARREAKRMLVGKRGGRESCSQADINDLMVKLANAGRRVVRLKSGDPMIFGRAGEELARLHAEGIEVHVVPGITSALAMAAALGVSLTHRDHAQSVRFVTGHSRRGELPETIDWPALADASTTTVFYMGGRTAARIAERLHQHGMPQTTPVVICAAVSRPGEKRWQGCLADLPKGIAKIGYEQPVLVAIGDVFSAVAIKTDHEQNHEQNQLPKDIYGRSQGQ